MKCACGKNQCCVMFSFEEEKELISAGFTINSNIAKKDGYKIIKKQKFEASKGETKQNFESIKDAIKWII